ncbi:MAG: hypothetical protein ACI3ZZ_01765 [Candidatus Aphodosoma sp.]
MQTKIVKLSEVRVNENNPRTIKEHKLNKLIERLLVFPKMIKIRPIVVDNTMMVLGGNMRLRAYSKIATYNINDITLIAGQTKNYQRITKEEQLTLLEYWQKWLEAPSIEVIKADSLSDEEKKEFIISDNASFGEWDYDLLANNWDSEDLESWGVDIWQAEEPHEEEIKQPDNIKKITIEYSEEQESSICSLLGLTYIDKTKYNIKELI